MQLNRLIPKDRLKLLEENKTFTSAYTKDIAKLGGQIHNLLMMIHWGEGDEADDLPKSQRQSDILVDPSAQADEEDNDHIKGVQDMILSIFQTGIVTNQKYADNYLKLFQDMKKIPEAQ